ncbi:hypothetical protein O6H91_Y023400 [Diphasiastrum complanatum]|nr:hypothetical protein O6H91_Y023400 [Diphasiastrum complanatum]
MDPRFTLQPNLVVDQGSHLHGAGTGIGASPAFFHSASLQPFYTGFEQTLHSVDEHAIPASFSSSGQNFFVNDPLQRGTTLFQGLPTSGAASGIGSTLGHHDLEISALNSNFQLVNRPQGAAEIGLSGFQSVYAPSYTDMSAQGHVYGSNAPVYIYQPYPQAQIHDEHALLPRANSSGFASRTQLLPEQGLHREYSNVGFLARRREVDQRIKLERQRVLDYRRELQWTQDAVCMFIIALLDTLIIWKLYVSWKQSIINAL